MPNIYCNNFSYNGKSIKDFVSNAITCTFENSDDGEVPIVKKEWDKGDFTPDRNMVLMSGVKYSETLQFKVTIVKEDGNRFAKDEKRKIAAWLTSCECPKSLVIDNVENANIVYYGLFSEISKYRVGANYVGMSFSFECNAPYGFEVENNTYSVSSSKSITINNTSDELQKNLFPSIFITPHAIGAINITNNTTGVSTIIDALQNIPIYINNQLCIFRDDNNSGSYTISNFNCKWFYLTTGVNNITITGNCDITIKCEYPRKVGA